ncbi:MAG: hypothetical protein ACR2QK_19065 [Acidimicrobiales bacterium]
MTTRIRSDQPASSTRSIHTPPVAACAGLRKTFGAHGAIADLTTELAVLTLFAVAILGAGTLRLRHQLTH